MDLHSVGFWESWYAWMGKTKELVIETGGKLEGHYIQSLWVVVVDGSDILDLVTFLEKRNGFGVLSCHS